MTAKKILSLVGRIIVGTPKPRDPESLEFGRGRNSVFTQVPCNVTIRIL